jgi:hypothetical protein
MAVRRRRSTRTIPANAGTSERAGGDSTGWGPSWRAYASTSGRSAGNREVVGAGALAQRLVHLALELVGARHVGGGLAFDPARDLLNFRPDRELDPRRCDGDAATSAPTAEPVLCRSAANRACLAGAREVASQMLGEPLDVLFGDHRRDPMLFGCREPCGRLKHQTRAAWRVEWDVGQARWSSNPERQLPT